MFSKYNIKTNPIDQTRNSTPQQMTPSQYDDSNDFNYFCKTFFDIFQSNNSQSLEINECSLYSKIKPLTVSLLISLLKWRFSSELINIYVGHLCLAIFKNNMSIVKKIIYKFIIENLSVSELNYNYIIELISCDIFKNKQISSSSNELFQDLLNNMNFIKSINRYHIYTNFSLT